MAEQRSPAFILIGGFGGAADFDFVAPMLGRDHEVTVVDPGGTVVTSPDSVLVGYGVGAVQAAESASAHAVRALVLICGWADATPRLVDWSRHASDPAFARHTMVGAGSDRTPLVRPELLELVGAHAPLDLPAIACPTLVIGATFDTVAPAHQSRLLYGGIAGARYAEVATGHAALVERPAEVLGLIAEFAAQHSLTPAPR